MAQRRLERVAAALALCALLAAPALAQITTGNVAGHGQGRAGRRRPRRDGRARSARRKGTKSAPAVTNESGDYVFPNVTADTYTVEVTMEGFKTLTRQGVAVSGGDRVAVPAHDARSRRRDRNRQRHGRSAARAVAERRALVRRRRPSRSRTCRSTAATSPASTAVDARRRQRRRVGRRHPPRRRRPEQHHDGRHLGDGHRQQRPDAQHEHRVDRRSQDPDAGLPGRVRPVERPADHRRHQERHQPVPRVGLRHPDQLRLEREHAGSTSKNGDPKPKTRPKTLGYTIGGPVGKPGGNNKLFFFYAHEYRPTTAAINSGNPIRLRVPTAARARRRLLADARQQRRAVQLHQGSASTPPARDRPAGCFRTAASSARFRRTGCIGSAWRS